jgi:hypothetical protein
VLKRPESPIHLRPNDEHQHESERHDAAQNDPEIVEQRSVNRGLRAGDRYREPLRAAYGEREREKRLTTAGCLISR